MSLDRLEVYADECPKDLKKLVESEGGTLKIEEAGNMVNVSVQGLKPVDVWEAQVNAFVKAVRKDEPSPIDPEGVLITNVIMDGIARSVEKGKEVSAKMPEI